MWPPASRLAASGKDLSVLAQGPVPYGGPGTGHCSHSGRSLYTAARLPFPVEIRVYPGAAQGEWAGVDLSKAPQLSGRPEEASAEVGLLP